MASLDLSLEEFGINQYGGNSKDIGLRMKRVNEKPKEKARSPVVSYEDERGYLVKTSSFDFVQEIARVSGREQNAILKMCIDLVRRECHVGHIPGGNIEETLVLISSRWERFCDLCDRLKEYVELEHEAKRRANREREERMRKKRDKRLNRIMKNKEEEEEEMEEEEANVYLKHKGFGSPLLMNTNKTAYSLHCDTENIRRALIWCLMCHSVAVQRLVRCGKFVSDRYKVHLRYSPIQQETLEEFVHWIDPLKNAFYTCQMSAFNFVDIVRCMVEKGGVNHYVNVILKVARVLETRRIEKMHTTVHTEDV
jgi:hypothetical protein